MFISVVYRNFFPYAFFLQCLFFVSATNKIITNQLLSSIKHIHRNNSNGWHFILPFTKCTCSWELIYWNIPRRRHRYRWTVSLCSVNKTDDEFVNTFIYYSIIPLDLHCFPKKHTWKWNQANDRHFHFGKWYEKIYAFLGWIHCYIHVHQKKNEVNTHALHILLFLILGVKAQYREQKPYIYHLICLYSLHLWLSSLPNKHLPN